MRDMLFTVIWRFRNEPLKKLLKKVQYREKFVIAKFVVKKNFLRE